TTVATVGPYFQRFVELWPTVGDLAAAPRDAVLTEWAGLGYYARARNLHACAQAVVADRGGVFPDTEDALRTLPGIGAYTAAAVAAIAFDRPAAVVDGNVERVMARLYGVTDPLPGSKPALKKLAAGLTPAVRPGDYAQAVMDLGATVCTPRRPACAICPLSAGCAARRLGVAETLPRRAPKKARPQRYGVAFWAVRPDGHVLLRRRAENGLLGGMMEVPSTEWREARWSVEEALEHAPAAADWRQVDGAVRHVFTHFGLELSVLAATVESAARVDGRWVARHSLPDEALPTVMRKVLRHLGADRV
ncbi:MAG: A/G-specific adenine glycosylase, partial [Acetobacterales bacterium]